ncbi:TIGR04053 family radical SAM/SPASM domain-containing protein [Flaviflexus massiliensis]|uniref:TIGR04053 family radical SAM/SPASM domain-containing protein n=1 Tax=Flaviflexus massiliensis TaxID=1522309 RepID=UPI0006D576ED|nr:TIGR04053 family radical SAM/SPASM domain-containing protein [Flaviflexus massiliensis]
MSLTSAPRPRRPVRTVRHDPARQPMLVIWEATRACQLSCLHCRAEATPARNPFELTTDEATTLMAEVLSFGKPAPIFVISGGDCFERDDLYEIARRGVAMGLHVAVSPSGTKKLNRDSLMRLQDVGVNTISLSLDGATKESHDGFRRVQGTFENTVAGWEAARELGMKVQLNSVVARHNVMELPDIAKLVRDLGVMTWSGFLLVPTGRGIDLGALTAQECEDVLNLFYDLGETVPIKTTEGHHFRRVSIQRHVLDKVGRDHREVMNLGLLYEALYDRSEALGLVTGERSRRAPINISSGNGFVFINHVGQVTPSGFLDVPAGNVRDSSLVDLYRNSELFSGIRRTELLEGKCGRCEYRDVCGGSRSRAYNSTGNIYAEEPLCIYEPGSFPFNDEVNDLII